VNFFAHGRSIIDQPYQLAGVATPDWLSVLDRRTRARSKYAAPHLDDPDPRIAQLAKGITKHHDDDRWFHQSRTFVEMNLEFTVEIRELIGDEDGFRPRFLGHILIELILDSTLINDEPELLDAYYESIRSLDYAFVEAGVSRMTNKPATRLQELIPRFCDERFLYDYQDDDKLLVRLNQVMRRVKLSPLPERVKDFFPHARREVRQRRGALLDNADSNEAENHGTDNYSTQNHEANDEIASRSVDE